MDVRDCTVCILVFLSGMIQVILVPEVVNLNGMYLSLINAGRHLLDNSPVHKRISDEVMPHVSDWLVFPFDTFNVIQILPLELGLPLNCVWKDQIRLLLVGLNGNSSSPVHSASWIAELQMSNVSVRLVKFLPNLRALLWHSGI